MFADLMLIPAVPKDKETEFRRWYHWSSGYTRQLGFPERFLLKERGGQAYAILEEHESYERLLAFLNHIFPQLARRRVAALLEDEAVPRFYYTMLNRGHKRRSRFVNLVFFPPVRETEDVLFRQWFWSSSASWAKLPEPHRRLLLWPIEGGNYAAVIEHDGHTAPPDKREWACPLLDEDPLPRYFERV